MKYFIGMVISSFTIMHFSLFLMQREVVGGREEKKGARRSHLRQIRAMAHLALMVRQPLGVSVIDGWMAQITNNK